jgi:hypothetical protein
MKSAKTAALAIAAGLGAVPALALVPLAGATPAPCTVHDTTAGHLASYSGVGALQTGINGATAGDTLTVGGTCTGDVTVAKNLTITGGATLDGTGTLGSVVTIPHGVSAALAGPDITGGTGNYDVNGYAPIRFGGGIDNEGSLKLTNVSVTHNSAGNGGGIFNHDGTLVLKRTSVNWNTAPDGSGIDNYGTGAHLTITNGQINRNTAVYIGGGLKNWPGDSAVLIDTSVNANHARDGGGLYSAGTMVVTNGAVNDDVASGWGGGIFNDVHGSLTVTRTTIHGDRATNVGGGIATNAPAALAGDTITGNVSAAGGGGIYLSHATVRLARTNVSRNTAPRGGGIYAWGGKLVLGVGATVNRNTATVHHGGGGIFWFGGTTLVGVKAGQNVRLNTNGNVVA